jgi:hypothetical protein
MSSQKPGFKGDEQKPVISELQASLDRAHQIIQKLRYQNAQFKSFIPPDRLEIQFTEIALDEEFLPRKAESLRPILINEDKQSQEVAELQAKLRRAQQIIQQLQHQNSQLQSFFIYFDNHEVQQTQMVPPKEPPPLLTDSKTRQSFESSPKILSNPSETHLSLLSQLKFSALTVAVAITFVAVGLALTYRQFLEPEIVSKPMVSPPPSESPSPFPSPSPSIAFLTPIPQIQSRENIVYYLTSRSSFQENDPVLNKVVQQILSIAQDRKLPTNNLSITIIDVKTGAIAGHNQDTLRYPASIVKMFWLVALYNQFSVGILHQGNPSNNDIKKMIKDSDNEASSRIVDLLTDTESGPKLDNPQQYKDWEYNRDWLNRFFRAAEYEKINISQKTFPIPSENLPEPQGRDLQMRGNKLNQPIRNKITTRNAARLMHEIVTGKAISIEDSLEIKKWLTWDLNNSDYWRNRDPNAGHFNPIRAFFGEKLPRNIDFASKAGWTLNTRQEVAFIDAKDNKTQYILAVFAEDPAYAKSETIFPEISRQVFERMKQ